MMPIQSARAAAVSRSRETIIAGRERLERRCSVGEVGFGLTGVPFGGWIASY